MKKLFSSISRCHLTQSQSKHLAWRCVLHTRARGRCRGSNAPSFLLLPATRFPPTSQHRRQQRGAPQGILGRLGRDHRVKCGEEELMDPSYSKSAGRRSRLALEWTNRQKNVKFSKMHQLNIIIKMKCGKRATCLFFFPAAVTGRKSLLLVFAQTASLFAAL